MRIPGNPAPLVKASLVAFHGANARVVRDVPNEFAPGDTPVILVADDGGPLNWPVMSKSTIRVTVFAHGKDLARALASKSVGHLHENVPAGLSHIFRDGTSVLEARDPKTGADMASFTVTATVRTTTV